jgi:hypothetical protein
MEATSASRIGKTARRQVEILVMEIVYAYCRVVHG